MSESNNRRDQLVDDLFRKWDECPLCRKEIEEGQATKVSEMSGVLRRVHTRCLLTVQTFAETLQEKSRPFNSEPEEREELESVVEKTVTRLTGVYRIAIMLIVLMAITLVLQFVLR